MIWFLSFLCTLIDSPSFFTCILHILKTLTHISCTWYFTLQTFLPRILTWMLPSVWHIVINPLQRMPMRAPDKGSPFYQSRQSCLILQLWWIEGEHGKLDTYYIWKKVIKSIWLDEILCFNDWGLKQHYYQVALHSLPWTIQ